MTAAKRFLLHDSYVELLNVDLGRYGPVRVTCRRCGQSTEASVTTEGESPMSAALAALDELPCSLAIIGPDGLPIAPPAEK